MNDKFNLIDLYYDELDGVFEEYSSNFRKEYKIIKDNSKGLLERYSLDENTTINLFKKCSGSNWTYENPKDNRHIFEIAYCINGEMNLVTKPDNKIIQMKKGDIAVYVSTVDVDSFDFEYINLDSVSIHMDILKNPILKNFVEKDSTYKDILKLIEKEKVYIFKGTNYINSISKEIYKSTIFSMLDFLNLKLNANTFFVNSLRALTNHMQILNSEEEKLLKEIKNFIKINIISPPTISDINKAYKISPYKIQQLFKKAYGKTYYEYIKKMRIEKSIQIIENSEKTIMEVSLLVGYENPSKFTSAFKSIMKITPSEYKNSFSQ